MTRAALLVRLALGAFTFAWISQADPAGAHEDQPGKPIGEYRVTLLAQTEGGKTVTRAITLAVPQS